MAAREGLAPELRVAVAEDHLDGALALLLVERGRREDQAAPLAGGQGEGRDGARGDDQRVPHVLERAGLLTDHHAPSPGVPVPRRIAVPHLLDAFLRAGPVVGVGQRGDEGGLVEVIEEPVPHLVAGRIRGRGGRRAEQGQE